MFVFAKMCNLMMYVISAVHFPSMIKTGFVATWLYNVGNIMVLYH